MKSFEIHSNSSKSYTIYTEENGKYFYQNMNWWDKGGYCVPQTKKRVSKERWERMQELICK